MFAVDLQEAGLKQQRVLIIEREASTEIVLRDHLPEGTSVNRAGKLTEALSLIRFEARSGLDFDLILLELSDEDSSLETLLHLARYAPRTPIAVIFDHDRPCLAEEALSRGARWSISKPVTAEGLATMIENALGQNVFESRHASTSAPSLASTDVGMGEMSGLIGRSAQMQRTFSLVRKVAPSDVNVLITGESGTGKEMIAAAIHKCSRRRNKPFIAINCAAIPRELLESELFGHAKGAFTGATATRRGLFEEAHEGTILLDEIGDLPLPLQAKILRLLQTKEVKPLGQNSIKEVDVRIISATHKNLKALIQVGEFREDLYYRLNVMPIHLPPLRERRDDIPLLADYFLRKYANRVPSRVKGFTRSALSKLTSLSWKGNVRELENAVERSIVLADGDLIDESDILVEEIDGESFMTEDIFRSGMTLKDIEREYIKYVLGKTGNKKETATRILGIDRKTLYRKERQYGLKSGPTDLM